MQLASKVINGQAFVVDGFHVFSLVVFSCIYSCNGFSCCDSHAMIAVINLPFQFNFLIVTILQIVSIQVH